ncbi:MAG: DUF488 domain-containing protein [Ignavibacteriaceae bacterium]|nr:DUF488 domain-containing protein [Ignavibacteriaceae bacterium]
MKKIKIKRVYDEYSPQDGVRIMIDRLYPRGIKKEDAKIDFWIKEIAPSNDLRKWFTHDPKKWTEFKKKYIAELKDKDDLCKEILSKEKVITLVYAAKDEEHNNAIVLKDYLEKILSN